jgi:hypothetical protein
MLLHEKVQLAATHLILVCMVSHNCREATHTIKQVPGRCHVIHEFSRAFPSCEQ